MAAGKTEDHREIVSMCLALQREDPGIASVELEQVRETLSLFGRDRTRGRAVVAEVSEGITGYALLVPLLVERTGR